MSHPATGDLEATCVLPAAAQLGECPVWDPDEARLYWIDIDGRAIHRYDPASGLDEQRAAPGRPGSLALTGVAGRLLVALEGRLALFDWDPATWRDWVALEPEGAGNRLNDGRCDPGGRFWVGSMFDPSSARKATGLLHRVEPDGTSVTVRSEIGVANGLAFSPDGRTMYFADTHRDTVWAYDYDLATGDATNERVFLDFGPLPGRPDGACVDEAGCYWVACVTGGMVLRVTPAGVVDRRVRVPVDKPTMPAFGGPGLSTLFITTIGGGGSHQVDPSQPEAGSVFAIEAGVKGLPEPRFGGTGHEPAP
ncbi:MAG TPA: SMP-30/gluconolactonase/LRE family protein [Methylomirabilota bacterium]|nr:SMP-30/gluconolactonase/LRE family protein [Methylomirabilota bacterium]